MSIPFINSFLNYYSSIPPTNSSNVNSQSQSNNLMSSLFSTSSSTSSNPVQFSNNDWFANAMMFFQMMIAFRSFLGSQASATNTTKPATSSNTSTPAADTIKPATTTNTTAPAKPVEPQMTTLEAAKILNDNLDVFDQAAGIGHKDYLITKKDLEVIANNTSPAMEKQRKAAQHILNNQSAYNALDVTVAGQKADTIIGGLDLKIYLEKQGLKNVTNSSDFAPWLNKNANTTQPAQNTTNTTTPATNTNTTKPTTNTGSNNTGNSNTNSNNTTTYTPPANKAVGPQDSKSDPIIQAKGTNYFVDSVKGSDSNDGLSPDRPLKTLAKINGRSFQPGDVINLARGSRFTGGLNVTASGTADKPIIVRAYGNGERPEINNTGHYSNSVVVSGDHIQLESLKATGAMQDGFQFAKGAEYNVIKNCEATDVGIGIAFRGANNVATQNWIHDLHLVVNTKGAPGTMANDDDYGAVGAWLFASNNVISYNKMENLKGQSYDYGMDGGGCEVTGDVSNCKIIGNEVTNTNGFMEFSQGNGGVAANNIIADNIIKDFGDVFTCIHTTDHFAVNVKNLQMINNTLINSADKLNNKNNLYDFVGADLSAQDYILKDNKLIAH